MLGARRTAFGVRSALVVLVVALAACAPSAPLLAGARTTPARRGDVLVGAAARVPLSSLRRAEQPSQTESDLLALAGREGIVPVVATRIGLTRRVDLGLTVAGSATNVAVRLTVPLDPGGAGALLLGVAPEVRWAGPQGFSGVGLGADIFAVLSRSFSGVYEVWTGLRLGLIAASGKGVERPDGPIDASAFGVRAGGLIGLALGMKTITGMFELAVDYESYSGEIAGRRAGARGLVVSPAFALRVRL